jgi:predicted AAA+ superfamily ATPase
LVLRGARQVGKTYLVEHWGAEHFESVVTVQLLSLPLYAAGQLDRLLG